MKPVILLLFSALALLTLQAQDAGPAEAIQRFSRPHFSFLSVGSMLNVPGDYAKGFQLELGYGKRLNKVVYLQGFIAYQKFTTDYTGYDFYVSETDEPTAFPPGSIDNEVPYDPYDDSFEVGLSGGDLSVFTLNGIIRLNLIPYSESAKVLVYGFLQPCIGVSVLSDIQKEVRLTIDYNYDQIDESTRESTSSFVSGISLGPGIEILPTNSFSFFAQAAFNGLFGKNLILDKASYTNRTSSINDPDFPIKSSGALVSISVKVGIQYNF
ncbi:hypothetical protein QQ054_18195 [Oscillatoria amoena NRMC-F 0135]|nr:hypothetical protein [Oscillatoria amoena NRMC-F 0135]